MFDEMKEVWTKCTACGLCQTRRNVVFGRGSTTPFVVFLGEAPGRYEDEHGVPWIGPAGRFLETALADALYEPFDLHKHGAFYLNVIACRPCDTPRGPNRPPTPQEVSACRPRVIHQLTLLRPEVIVRLGLSSQVATSWLDTESQWNKIRIVNLPHPAALLRRGGVQAHDYDRYVETLRSIWR